MNGHARRDAQHSYTESIHEAVHGNHAPAHQRTICAIRDGFGPVRIWQPKSTRPVTNAVVLVVSMPRAVGPDDLRRERSRAGSDWVFDPRSVAKFQRASPSSTRTDRIGLRTGCTER
jgi:hypothetical protein